LEGIAPGNLDGTAAHDCRRASAALVLLAILTLPARAVDTQPDKKDKTPTLQDRVTALVEAYEKSQKAVAGVSVMDLRTGTAVASIRAGDLFIPASNQKLLTTAFSLVRLGGDFHFTTTVCLLEGKHLLVIGDYDPTLGDPVLAEQARGTIYDELDRWAAAAAKATGGKLAGDVLVMTNPAHKAFHHPDWPASQLHNWYAAPVAMLNFHNNCFDVTFRMDGQNPVAVVSPASRFIRVTNQAHLGKRHVWSLATTADDSAVTVRGTVTQAVSEPTSVAANHPPLLLGRVLADRLMRAGVKFSGQVRAVDRSAVDITRAAAIAETRTPLAVAMARANKRSLNMAAECILLRAGDGTWEGSARIMTDKLVSSLGLPVGGLVVADGSGLSRRNRVSPSAMTTLLAGVARRSDAGVFLRSLAVAGEDGTLEGRMTRLPEGGSVLGKSGYIYGVSCLSGYILDKGGAPVLAFSTLVNNVPPGNGYIAKRLQDGICKVLLESLAVKTAASAPAATGPQPR